MEDVCGFEKRSQGQRLVHLWLYHYNNSGVYEFIKVSHSNGSDLTLEKRIKQKNLRCFSLFLFDSACFGSCLCSGDRL